MTNPFPHNHECACGYDWSCGNLACESPAETFCRRDECTSPVWVRYNRLREAGRLLTKVALFLIVNGEQELADAVVAVRDSIDVLIREGA